MARSDTIVQVELTHRHEAGTTGCVVWVEPKVREGDRITLKGDDRPWDVVHVFGEPVPRSSVRQDWHNNI